MRGITMIVVLSVLMLGCNTTPGGPSVRVLPGQQQSFEAYQADDERCRRYAEARLGGSPAAEAAQTAGLSAATTAALGAVSGALIGAGTGRAARGAAMGAGTGLTAGAVLGTVDVRQARRERQQRYDHAYTACMSASAHQVPGIPVR